MHTRCSPDGQVHVKGAAYGLRESPPAADEGHAMTLPSPPAFAVEAAGLVRRFGSVTALDGVGLQVEVGEVHGLLGSNGAGKTTLLRLLLGLITPDAGTLRVFGRSPTEPGWNSYTAGEPSGSAENGGGVVAGFVETPAFYPYLSGRRNLDLLATLDGGAPAGRIDEVLDVVGLSERAGDRVRGYSFGMRQRLGIAAALLCDPRLLVLDEPTNGLDPAGIRAMRTLITQLAAGGHTVLLSSHNMGEIESLCDNVTILRSGTVAHGGSVEDLRQRAPAAAHRLRTSDDPGAIEVASDRPNLTAVPHDEEGLAVRATEATLDEYVLALGGAGIAVRSLQLEVTSLESLFFLLTEPGADPTSRPGAESAPGSGRDSAPRSGKDNEPSPEAADSDAGGAAASAGTAVATARTSSGATQ